MSGYNGRRGPNVSQYVAQLNTVPPPQDTFEPAAINDDDFSLFTNADFLDINGSGTIDLNSPLDLNLDFETQIPGQATGANPQRTNSSSGPAESKMEFNMNSDFQFADFSNFSNSVVDPSMQNLPHSQPNNYSIPGNFTSPVTSSVSPVAQGFEQPAGKKRKLDNSVSTSQQSLDESARVAAEEDKRRRNTAASARFRVKKKQREQALEKTAKEMTERVSVLETRIQQLETENTWLKSLITEKSNKGTTDIKAILEKREQNESTTERSTGSRTDGVGTVKAEGTKA